MAPGKLLACISLVLAGCAATPEETRPLFRDSQLSMQGAQVMVIPGSSTKAEVSAALGSATVVRFDSGYEVWAYREKPPKSETPGAEFVVLFTPAGIVQKTRIRPRYEAPAK
ncbi:hypothetical protein PMI15_01861 [Polaromonas sp. CF318]|uniref:hypothetical protein n=1 Tax=Polaromonas sp. CF318 TaxID=1144318 RepID=UPI000270E2F8|nr:hypothetical protein [Polaromonas sp. CF318]EJL85429.1 hypothetical protein PMI15_01861 [Polaromonas sp. CF318]